MTVLQSFAADLASFNNVDVAEALDALLSALLGDVEPLRRFVPDINEAMTLAFGDFARTAAPTTAPSSTP